MSILDTLLNIGSASAANRRAFEYTKALQQHQYDLNRQALREYYSNNRFSLEQAGYNPLLAVPGSTAQGFTAGASMSPVMPGSSGAGTEEINAITSARSAIQNVKNMKEQNKEIKERTRSLELENKKKELDLKTNPKNIIVDKLEGENLPKFITNGIQKLKNKGIDITPSSATGNQDKFSNVIKLHDGKPYVQKGVPKSVVKSFEGSNSAKTALDRFPRVPNIGTIHFKGYKRYKNPTSKPPKSFPVGM